MIAPASGARSSSDPRRRSSRCMESPRPGVGRSKVLRETEEPTDLPCMVSAETSAGREEMVSEDGRGKGCYCEERAADQ